MHRTAVSPVVGLRRVHVPFLLALAQVLAVPAVGWAGFSSLLVPVSGAPANVQLLDLGVDDLGDAVITWIASGAPTTAIVHVRRVRVDGTLGPDLRVSDGTQQASSVALAVTATGSVLVAWSEFVFPGPASLRARWLSPADALGPQLTLRNGGVNSSSDALAATARVGGGATVAWHNFSTTAGIFRTVEGRHVAADGSIGMLLLPTSLMSSTGVRVAPDSVGGALCVWTRSGIVNAQGIGANDAIGALVPQTGNASADAALAGDAMDRFQIVYRTGNGPYAVYYRRLGADGTSFSQELALDPPGPGFVGADSVVATNAAGRSLVGWRRFVGAHDVVTARFIGSDGIPEFDRFSAPDPTVNQQAPQVGIGQSGGGAIAWSTAMSGMYLGMHSVWGRVISSAGSPSAPEMLSTADLDTSLARLRIGAADVGAVAWAEGTGTDRQIVVRQILPPPDCPAASATVVQGLPTPVALRCTGLQLAAAEIASPPTHGTLSAPDVASQTVVYTPVPGYEGLDTFDFRGANRGGTSATRTATIVVGRDSIGPEITRFEISASRLRVGPAAQARRRKTKTPSSATFTLEFSEPATATVTIEKKRRCSKRRRKRGCQPWVAVGTLEAATTGTGTTLELGQQIGVQRLRAGSYRATAVATDVAGNPSAPKEVAFRKVRR
jgi:hypothetical protein